ncbi:MAG: hypothetical protein IPG25_17520 [Proteobacteria bacterium]|nr:hypothetical protein [Pseudomonadota bacterium]
MWATNSPIELKTALKVLLTELPGQYDNAGQVYFETAIPDTADPPHKRVFMLWAPLAAPDVGEHVLVSTLRLGGDSGEVVDGESAVWTLAVDPASKAVRMTPFRSRKSLESGSVVTRADIAPAEGLCTVLWRKYGTELRGVADTTTCKVAAHREYILNAEELWINNLPDNPMKAHVRLGKARDFECLFGYRPADGEPQVSNGQHMHDRGDTLIWETAAPNQHKFEYELLRGMWPSNSGGNYTDMLRITIYALDDSAPPKREFLGIGWAGSGGDRASFGDGTYNGRCKLFDPDMPPPK